MRKDFFGKDIYRGSVVIISRANRYCSDMEIGIVTKITGDKIFFIEKSYSGAGHSSWTRIKTEDSKVKENKNIIVVENFNNEIKKSFPQTVINYGIIKNLLPKDYKLGDNIDLAEAAKNKQEQINIDQKEWVPSVDSTGGVSLLREN